MPSREDGNLSFEEEVSELMDEQFLFTESVCIDLPMGVEIYDARGILRFINDSALRIYGVDDRNTVVGTVNLFNSPYMDEVLEAKVRGGEEIELEFEYDFDKINSNAYFKSKNRDTMIYAVRIVAVRNKKGSIIGHILLTNDVTAVKEAEFHTEESKKDMEMAMDTANMSSWVYDVDKKVFGTLYGKAIVEDGVTLAELLVKLHPQDHVPLMQLFSRLIDKEIQQGQITVRFYDEREGQYRYYESRMRLSMEHFGKRLIVGTQMDVTDNGKENTGFAREAGVGDAIQ